MSPQQLSADLASYGPDSATYHGSVSEAFNYCGRLTRSEYENFSVLSWLLPKPLRPHFSAVYAYCRWADDLADQHVPDDASFISATGDKYQSEQLLNWWLEQLEKTDSNGPFQHPVFVALAQTRQQFQLSREPFQNLVSAFKQDQHRTRYDSVSQLFDYCQRSANPVGQIILALFGFQDEKRWNLSNKICTGLQWANFCQDIACDYHRLGRIYLPREEWRRNGVVEEDFARSKANTALRALLKAEVIRAEELLHHGRELVALLPREVASIIEAIAQGGLAICQSIRQQHFDVLKTRPTISKWQKAKILGRAWWHCRHSSVSNDLQTTTLKQSVQSKVAP